MGCIFHWIARRREEREKGRRPLSGRLIGIRGATSAQLRFGVLVIREFIEPIRQVVRSNVPEVEIVGMFPDVASEENRALACGERISAVRALGDLSLPSALCTSQTQPEPN